MKNIFILFGLVLGLAIVACGDGPDNTKSTVPTRVPATQQPVPSPDPATRVIPCGINEYQDLSNYRAVMLDIRALPGEVANTVSFELCHASGREVLSQEWKAFIEEFARKFREQFPPGTVFADGIAYAQGVCKVALSVLQGTPELLSDITWLNPLFVSSIALPLPTQDPNQPKFTGCSIPPRGPTA